MLQQIYLIIKQSLIFGKLKAQQTIMNEVMKFPLSLELQDFEHLVHYLFEKSNLSKKIKFKFKMNLNSKVYAILNNFVDAKGQQHKNEQPQQSFCQQTKQMDIRIFNEINQDIKKIQIQLSLPIAVIIMQSYSNIIETIMLQNDCLINILATKAVIDGKNIDLLQNACDMVRDLIEKIFCQIVPAFGEQVSQSEIYSGQLKEIGIHILKAGGKYYYYFERTSDQIKKSCIKSVIIQTFEKTQHKFVPFGALKKINVERDDLYMEKQFIFNSLQAKLQAEMFTNLFQKTLNEFSQLSQKIEITFNKMGILLHYRTENELLFRKALIQDFFCNYQYFFLEMISTRQKPSAVVAQARQNPSNLLFVMEDPEDKTILVAVKNYTNNSPMLKKNSILVDLQDKKDPIPQNQIEIANQLCRKLIQNLVKEFPQMDIAYRDKNAPAQSQFQRVWIEKNIIRLSLKIKDYKNFLRVIFDYILQPKEQFKPKKTVSIQPINDTTLNISKYPINNHTITQQSSVIQSQLNQSINASIPQTLSEQFKCEPLNLPNPQYLDSPQTDIKLIRSIKHEKTAKQLLSQKSGMDVKLYLVKLSSTLKPTFHDPWQLVAVTSQNPLKNKITIFPIKKIYQAKGDFYLVRTLFSAINQTYQVQKGNFQIIAKFETF